MGSWSLERIFIFQLEMKNIISYGQCNYSKTSKVKDKIKDCTTALSVVSSSLAWRLQPLNISINKVLKENLRDKLVGHWIGKTI